MAIQTSTLATAGNLTKYETEYRMGAEGSRLYDQMATELKNTFEPRGATTQVAWATILQPRPTTAVGSETSDFEPQTWTDVTTTITKQWLADGFKRHELQELKSALNVRATNAMLVGRLAMETIESVARRAATEGSVVFYGDGTHTTRLSLDLGTAGDNLTLKNFYNAKTFMSNWQHNNALFAIITPFQYADLLTVASGNAITNRAGYTEEGKRILYNFEVGTLADIKLIVSPNAKRFYAAGAPNASVVGTTLNGAVAAGARSIVVASNSNITAGMWLTIGTAQTGAESDTTIITEIVYVNATPSGTTVSVTGSGPGGGLMYAHASGVAVSNADTVHAAVFGHSESLAVDYEKYGRFGQAVPPFMDGNAKQWETHSFKYYGNYGRLDESQLIRIETSASGQ